MLAFFDAIGIFLIIPIINLMLTQEATLFFDLSRTQLIIFTILLLVVRTIFISFFVSRQYKIIYKFLRKLTTAIIKIGYKDIDGVYKKEEITQLGMVESNNVTVGVLLSLANLITETLVILILVSISLYSSPVVILISLIILSSLIFIWLSFIKKKLLRYGKDRVKIDEKRFAYANISTDGALEIHSYSVLDFCIKKFNELTTKSLWFAWIQQVIKNSQKYWIELSVIMTLSFISLMSIYISEISNDIITGGALIGLSLIKIIPSINRISTYNQSINYYTSSLLKIKSFLEKHENQ